MSLSACSLFEKGYDNQYGQYVPKHPRFKLKDKHGNTIPQNLDTINIYREFKRYYMGELVQPKGNDYYASNNLVYYWKFYSNGRALGFSKFDPSNGDPTGNINDDDLNPNNANYSKSYYFSEDGKKIQIEEFAYAEGQGMYIILDYYLNTRGDTLTMIYKKSKTVYVREILGENIKTYSVDW